MNYFVYLASKQGEPEGDVLSEHEGLIEAVQACMALEHETLERHLVLDASGHVAHFPSP